MLTRRHFLTVAALAAAGAGAAISAVPSEHWARYRKTLAIDGEAGSEIFSIDDTDPAIRKALEAARASGLGAILYSVAPYGRFWLNDAAFEATKASIARCRAKITTHSDYLLLVTKAEDLQRAIREKRLGIVMRFQGTEPLGEDADRIPLFRELGVRVMQLTHNRRNLVGDGAIEPSNAGLSKYGYEVVARLNEEKIVVDLAHGGQRTIAEALRASKAPVLISHAGCRALADLPRNVRDEDLRTMANRGGAIGIIFWPYLRTHGQPMAIDVIRHIEHAVNVCGEDHVGIGTDSGIAAVDRTPEFERNNRKAIEDIVALGVFGPARSPDLYTFIPDLNMADRFDRLAAMLASRGHSDSRIEKILGGNFARVLGQVWT